ncbi:MAG: glycosyltransferase family 9 protein [Vampirovibrionales bacterium]|nr:glycosyltransferase family 9 protein [Vampirovibrionales bacterium]
MSSGANSPSHTLVIPLRFLGDTLLTVPLLRMVSEVSQPDEPIDLLCSPALAPLMQACPYIRHVLPEPKKLADSVRLLARYQRVILLRKSVTWSALAAAAGVKIRLGYDKQRWPFGYKRWGCFLSHQGRYPNRTEPLPMAQSHLLLLRELYPGLTPQQCASPEALRLALWPEPQAFAALQQKFDALALPAECKFLSGSGALTGARLKLAALHLSAASHGKTIAPESFVPAILALQEAGYTVLGLGLATERHVYEALSSRLSQPIVNLAGQTALPEMAALFSSVQIFLGLDSGPMHMAAACNVPAIVAVFGPTHHVQWGVHQPGVYFKAVYNPLSCRPCYAKVCAHNRCKTELAPGWITDAVHAALTHLQVSVQHPAAQQF